MAEYKEQATYFGNDAKANDELDIQWGFNLLDNITDEEISNMLNCLRGELDSREYYCRMSPQGFYKL